MLSRAFSRRVLGSVIDQQVGIAGLARRSRRRQARQICEPLEPRTMLSGAPVSTTWNNTPNMPAGHLGQLAMLLSDGTVIVHAGGDSASALWDKLTPDVNGSYVNGTWSSITSMNLQRLFFGSNILEDGRIFVIGGEYSGPSGTANWTNTGEIYNPVSNTWTNITPSPKTQVGDEPSQILVDGRILVGDLSDNGTEIYNPSTNAWTAGPTKIRNDQSDEESWVRLPGSGILTYDIFASNALGHGVAERYVSSTNSWVDASAGNLPLLTSAAQGDELGGAVLLPDGRVFYPGANGNTAFYDTSTNLWSPGPVLPAGLTAGDAPAAVLPNGHVLLALSPIIANGNFPGPTTI